ncbi:leucine-rich repeat domain-containing protein [Marinicellulosiphila megalodicopiae]|uniref:leucine-rich repeat domain-containing protein n=1 Tax=Marinicellulosiphila megalodicopiae TaxID=2724896 RepID=UPI003BB162FB
MKRLILGLVISLGLIWIYLATQTDVDTSKNNVEKTNSKIQTHSLSSIISDTLPAKNVVDKIDIPEQVPIKIVKQNEIDIEEPTAAQSDSFSITSEHTPTFNITNPKLRQCLQNKLLVDEGEQPTLERMLYVTRLNCIADGLEGLEDWTQIHTLDLKGGGLTDISAIKTLVNMEDLVLFKNNLTNLDALEDMTQLKTLTANQNQIHDVRGLTNLDKLEYLVLKNNNIESLEGLGRLTSLTQLDLSFNNITNIRALSGLNNLTRLNLSNNNIQDLTPLANLSNLRRLTISNNQISKLNALASLNLLIFLVADGNQVSQMAPLLNINSLKFVDLSNNLISDISNLYTFTQVEVLLLDNNKIEDISPLTTLYQLYNVDLSNNPLNSDCSALSFILDRKGKLKCENDEPM